VWTDYRLGADEGYCSLVILDVTIRNEVDLPWKTNYNVGRYKLFIAGSSPNKKVRNYNEKFFEVLDNPLNLQGMEPGEERTGQIVYDIGRGIVGSDTELSFYRADPYDFGLVEVILQ